MFSPTVSIIIPLYNKEEWIIQTLLSVYSQSFLDWECIIINDGSTDDSLARVNYFINRHPANWRVLTIANSGQTIARNFGIRTAKADLIAFLDADDLWHPEKIQVQVSMFQYNSALDLIFCPYVIFRENQFNFFRLVCVPDPNKLARGWLSLRGFGGLIESTGMVRKASLTKFGVFENSLSMSAGLDLSIRIINSGTSVVTSEPLVFYRLSDSQFHKNEELLMKDLSPVAFKYASSPEMLESLKNDHLNYLYWSETRKRGYKVFIKHVLLAFLRLDAQKLVILYYLTSRNFISLYRGFVKRGQIRTFFETQEVSAKMY